MKNIDRMLLLLCCTAFIVIPFATITELHILFLIIIAGVCISWWCYLSYTKSAATFGLPPEDRTTAYEHIIWMCITTGFGTLFIVGAILLILLSETYIDMIIPICLIISTIRIAFSCSILGKDSIKFIHS